MYLNFVSKLFVMLLMLVPPAFAVDPRLSISQFAHTAWRIQEGAFNGFPYAITQTADGYLWIGTESALVRFDGVRFVPWSSPDGQELPSSRIFALLAARDGSLWIGTSMGLAHWKNNSELVKYSGTPGGITSILQDSRGDIWVTRFKYADSKGPLCKVAGEQMQCYGESEGIPFDYATTLTEDKSGNLWVGSYALCRWRPGSSSIYFRKELRKSEGLEGIYDLASGADGSLWAGLQGVGPHLGLQHFVEGVWKNYIVPGMNGSELQVTALLVDRDNTLWVGTLDSGVYRVHEGNADHFRSVDGLSGDSVERLYQDREGNLWVATTKGLDNFRDLRVTSYSTPEGLTVDRAGSVLAARNGTVWVGNDGALEFLRKDRFFAIREHHGLPGHQANALFEDHAGRLWVGVDNGLAIYEHGQFRLIGQSRDKPLDIVTAITEDMDHDVWAIIVTKPQRLVRIRDMKILEEITPPQVPEPLSLAADPKGGIWLGLKSGDLAHYYQGRLDVFSVQHGPNSGGVRNLYVDSDTSIWATTTDQLMRWKDGKIKTLDARNGLPCNSVYAPVKDNRGHLWLYTGCGIAVVSDSELERWWERPDAKVNFRTFDVLDGAQPAYAYFRPLTSRAPDGRLWSTNDHVLQMVDPAHLNENGTPPQVHVEQIIADRKSYSPGNNLRLPALTRDIEVDYTAPSFTAPQKVRFRYRLEGRDADWNDAETRRQAFYNDLSPGTYTFRVIACNNYGVWNEAGAAMEFSVAPAFFQTTWFRLSCIATFLALLGAAYQLRLRQMSQQFNMRLEGRVSERTRIARELHDTLLQSFHAALLRFQAAIDLLPSGEAKQRFDRAIEQAAQAITEGRDAVQDLRSSTVVTNDLARAISALGEELATNETNPSSAIFDVKVEGTSRDLHPILRDEVYRIAGEAVRNAFRHARAHRIEVEIRYDKRQFRLRVRDDGEGIAPNRLNEEAHPGHYGLRGMSERARLMGGKLAVWSEVRSGTEIDLSIPASRAYETPPVRLPSWLAEKFTGKHTKIKS